MHRAEYVPLDAVLGELDRWQVEGGEADFVTLAGSGEPTLHSSFGCVIDHARDVMRFSSALLTNGSLLYLDEVCAAAARADIVKVTLSAWDERSLGRLHRPHPDATFARLMAGALNLRKHLKGQLWAEVFLVPGVNDGEDAIRRIADCLERIGPDHIHLNTAVRPPAEREVAPLTPERLVSIAASLGPKAEVTASVPVAKSAQEWDLERAIELLRRHPCTPGQLAAYFGMEESSLEERLQEAVDSGRVRRDARDGAGYFMAE